MLALFCCLYYLLVGSLRVKIDSTPILCDVFGSLHVPALIHWCLDKQIFKTVKL